MTDFETAFAALTGNAPFPWQRSLYDRFLEDRPDNIPASCNLPTGLGKTSVIAVWLLALAAKPGRMPRRLVYVVNRRTVVDQTTDEVEKLRGNLPKVKTWFPELAISTLRGQFADNREWSADPSRPAVVCGTVDMIGSRLLFSGYGCGFKTRPLHAGFLGQDALVVHDEAHLEPAFQTLLLAMEAEQKREPAPHGDRYRLRVMELTATSRTGGDVFGLTDADRAEPEVRKRIDARKTIHLHENRDEKKLAEEVADRALKFKDSGRPVLVFVRRVDDVEKIVARLRKGGQQVQQLTGTLRGLERDRMADPREPDACPIFARFLRRPKFDAPEGERWKIEPRPGTVYLVCTSAGEVGVNISADHLVCDLSTFESVAQRFGRVNRFGDHPDTEIHVVHPKETDFDDTEPDLRRCRTLELLWWLLGDGSPRALGQLDPDARLAAFSPQPTILPTSDILFDAWALTSARGKLPGRPPVEPYLHGISDLQPTETHVAWREEAAEVTGEMLSEYDPEDLLDAYPLKPHELLREPSHRAFKHFEAMAKRLAGQDVPVWLVEDDGSVEVLTLAELADKDKKDRINGMTVIMPPSAGGLTNGMLDGTATAPVERSLDVADTDDRKRVRNNETDPTDMRRILTIEYPTAAEDDGGQTWRWFEKANEGGKSAKFPVAWGVHVADVERLTAEVVAELPLDEPLRTAVKLAG